MADTIEELYKEEIENSVLSSFLNNNNTFFEKDFETDFFTGKRQIVFEAISKLINKNVDANIPTVFTETGKDIEASYLSRLIEEPISHDLSFHYDVLQEAFLSRKLYMAYGKAIQDLKAGKKPDDIISETNLVIVTSEKVKQKSFAELSIKSGERFEKKLNGEIKPSLKTGFNRIDKIIGGFAAELIIIAARPGMGKTALAINFARNWGYMKVPGTIFSIEMPSETLIDRMVCDIGSIDNKYVFRNEWKELTESKKKRDAAISRFHEECSKIHEMPIEIDESEEITIDQICNRARRDKLKRDIKWVIVDYLGLIKGWNNEGVSPKEEITRRLKMLSKELKIPVIVLAQMNRKIDDREKKKPKLSDLRGSGSIEQDADVIIFPFTENNEVKTEEDQFCESMLFIPKNRKGQPGFMKGLKWQGHYFRFSEDPYYKSNL